MTATASGWDDDLGADRLEWLAEVVRIICLVRQHAPRWSGAIVQRGGDADVGDVARSHHDVMASLMDRRTLIVMRADPVESAAHRATLDAIAREAKRLPVWLRPDAGMSVPTRSVQPETTICDEGDGGKEVSGQIQPCKVLSGQAVGPASRKPRPAVTADAPGPTVARV